MMGNVFRKADSVMGCLGLEVNNCEMGMDLSSTDMLD